MSKEEEKQKLEEAAAAEAGTVEEDKTVEEGLEEVEHLAKDLNQIGKDTVADVNSILKEHASSFKTVEDRITDYKKKLRRKHYMANHPDCTPKKGDDYIKAISENVFKQKMISLEDSLQLVTLEKLLSRKHVVQPTTREVQYNLKRADKAINAANAVVEETLFQGQMVTIPYTITPLYNLISARTADKIEYKRANDKFIIALCKVIQTDYNSNRLYLSDVIRNFMNIEIFYRLDNEQGKKESNLLLQSLERIYMHLYVKSTPKPAEA